MTDATPARFLLITTAVLPSRQLTARGAPIMPAGRFLPLKLGMSHERGKTDLPGRDHKYRHTAERNFRLEHLPEPGCPTHTAIRETLCYPHGGTGRRQSIRLQLIGTNALG